MRVGSARDNGRLVMLAGNRKFLALMIMLLAPVLLAALGRIDAASALDYLEIIFATYVVGNVGEHATRALSGRRTEER